MRATGIVRKIDPLGRVVIPKEICRVNGIQEGTPLEFCVDGDKVILRKYQSSSECVFCGNGIETGAFLFKGKAVCQGCWAEMNRLGKVAV